MEIVEREKGVSRRNGGFDEGYQLMVEMVLSVKFLGLASGSGGGGVHGGASGCPLLAAESSGGHGEQGRPYGGGGAHTMNTLKTSFFF